jgi:predicted MPP superfamily phosphohydrolase
MMDHQPFGLHEAEDNAIDVQLSGHTHNGQLWPSESHHK